MPTLLSLQHYIASLFHHTRSALVSDQARLAARSVKIGPTILSRLCFLNFCDIGCALAVALVVNVSVLLVSAATFHSQGEKWSASAASAMRWLWRWW